MKTGPHISDTWLIARAEELKLEVETNNVSLPIKIHKESNLVLIDATILKKILGVNNSTQDIIKYSNTIDVINKELNNER